MQLTTSVGYGMLRQPSVTCTQRPESHGGTTALLLSFVLTLPVLVPGCWCAAVACQRADQQACGGRVQARQEPRTTPEASHLSCTRTQQLQRGSHTPGASGCKHHCGCGWQQPGPHATQRRRCCCCVWRRGRTAAAACRRCSSGCESSVHEVAAGGDASGPQLCAVLSSCQPQA